MVVAAAVGGLSWSSSAYASTLIYLHLAGGTYTAPVEGEAEMASQGSSELVKRLGIASLEIAPLTPPPGIDAATLETLLLAELASHWGGYDIEFSTKLPIDDRYTQVVVGEVGAVAGLERALGWSASDCGDENPNNLAFVFSDAVALAAGEFDITYLAVIVSQELAHTLGLDHIDGPEDAIMRPIPAKASQYRFSNTCLPVYAGSQGGPVVNVCNVHPQCPDGQQNDDEALAAVLGRKAIDDQTMGDNDSTTTQTETTATNGTNDTTMPSEDGDSGCRVAAQSSSPHLIFLSLFFVLFGRSRRCSR